MTNEEKIKELVNKCPLYQDCKEGYGLHQEAISNALQEYGEWVRQQTLEEAIASVPQEKTEDDANFYLDYEENKGFNSCRQQTLSNLQALKPKE